MWLVGKHDAAKMCIMLELFIQTPSMTTFSIWTFYNASKGGRLNMLLPVPLKKSFSESERESQMNADSDVCWKTFDG